VRARRRRPAHELRMAIDRLPMATRQAMLDGIESNRIIVGAYVDRRGGVCPMLAAHRKGERTSLVSFAQAWDRYTHANGRARQATDRELCALRAMLEASLTVDAQGDRGEPPLPSAKRRSSGPPRAPRDTGERDRTSELRDRPGWAWLRLFRRYDEYELALREVDTEPKRRRRELERV
jgi:hypothetical protein